MAGPDLDLLLRRVSRTFGLSLRLLPGSVRPALSLAYLLARASDSIADVATVPAAGRIALLSGLTVHWPPDALNRLEAAEPLPSADRDLLSALPDLLSQLDSSPDRKEIERVWATIRSGQIFDLERFEGEEPLTLDEARRYTGLVAGCVGVFWTDVCCSRVPRYSEASPESLRQLGYSFGCGLQWVNILRDRAADAAIGRVYVTAENFSAAMQLARDHLADGARYAQAVRPRRLRAACALPLLLADRTLDLIAGNPDAPRVKVGRWFVWWALLRALR